MEDFIKNKLSDYKPTFKEAYWTEMSAKLNKKKRKKRLLFIILSSAGTLVLTTLIWSVIHFNRNQVPTADPQEIAVEQHTTTNALADKNEKLLAIDEGKSEGKVMESSLHTNQTAASINKNTEQYSNNHNISKQEKAQISIDNTQKKGTAASFATEKRKTNTSNANEVVTTKEKALTEALVSGLSKGKSNSNHASKTILEKNPVESSYQQELNYISANEQRAQDGSYQISTVDAIAIQQLAGLSIPLFIRQMSLPNLSPLQQVKINVSTMNNPLTATAIQIGSGIVSTSSNDPIYEQSLVLKRYLKFDRSMLYSAFGFGAGRYTGKFHAIEHEQVSFRTFVENSVSQSLIPNDLYFLTIPLEFGASLGKLNAGINFSSEYLFAAHGKVVTSELSRTVAATENIQEPLEFTVEQKTNTQTHSTWVETKNVQKFNYSLGILAGYRAGKHWHISISGNYYPKGLYSFKRTVQSSASITGRKNNLKGGLHVAYIF